MAFLKKLENYYHRCFSKISVMCFKLLCIYIYQFRYFMKAS